MMASTTNAAPRSLDDMLKESREKRKAETLAQEIFGRRSKTPATAKSKPALGGSLASRVGVSKARPAAYQTFHTTTDCSQRPSSLPRTNSAPPRNARVAPPPPQLNRPSAREENPRPKQTFVQQPVSSDPIISAQSNGYSLYEESATNGSAGVSIRGAAAGPHIVVASNFAPGTTAADIESVMLDVGGSMTECRLVASNPTVIAEMTFVEKSGAEIVINTFNNKKADGRTLHVYWKHSGTGSKGVEPEPAPVVIAEDTMEVDENAQAREAENRLREERRGRPEREPRGGYPSAPRGERGYEEDYYRGPRRAEPAYQDGRYGFGRGYVPRGGRYRDDGRLGYSRGDNRQSWRS